MALPSEVQEISRGNESRESLPGLNAILDRLREAKKNGTYEDAVNEILALTPEAANDSVHSESLPDTEKTNVISFGRQRTSFVGAPAAPNVDAPTRGAERGADSVQKTEAEVEVTENVETVTAVDITELLSTLDSELQQKNVLYFLQEHPAILSARAEAKKVTPESDEETVQNAYTKLKSAMESADIGIGQTESGSEETKFFYEPDPNDPRKDVPDKKWPPEQEPVPGIDDPAIGTPDSDEPSSPPDVITFPQKEVPQKEAAPAVGVADVETVPADRIDLYNIDALKGLAEESGVMDGVTDFTLMQLIERAQQLVDTAAIENEKNAENPKAELERLIKEAA